MKRIRLIRIDLCNPWQRNGLERDASEIAFKIQAMTPVSSPMNSVFSLKASEDLIQAGSSVSIHRSSPML